MLYISKKRRSCRKIYLFSAYSLFENIYNILFVHLHCIFTLFTIHYAIEIPNKRLNYSVV